mgnify:FL=1
MPYGEAKVYSDGAHFVAIPHSTNPTRRRKKPPEEEIEVKIKAEKITSEATSNKENSEGSEEDKISGANDTSPENVVKDKTIIKRMTRKELFEKLYYQSVGMRKSERKTYILTEMKPYFKDEELAKMYLDSNIERKTRNTISRRIRLHRKANLQEFNFFVTFTYSDELHTEDSFRKGLRTCLRHFVERKNWRYIGVWERSPEKKRLHFHGIFYIPDGTMPGLLFEKEDYSTTDHRMQKSVQNTYFNDKFGRCDFEEIKSNHAIDDALRYLVKYIEKSGEKIVYSKGLPQYFISDIMDEDIICAFGVDDRKLLLFDNFRCWDEGCYMGRVSKEVIAQMRKSN